MADGMTMKLRVNKKLPGHAVGTEVEIPIGSDGQPAELFWRRRLRDAPVDGCVSVVLPKAAAPVAFDDAPEEPTAMAADSDGSRATLRRNR